jgi:antitoxin component YwqK of YwqJK toxin-antitoxin module
MIKVDIEDCEFDEDLVVYENIPFTGVLISNYDNGNIQKKSEYLNGLPHGFFEEFYIDGKLKKTWNSENGRATGIEKEFYENGLLKIEESSEYGVLLSSKKWDENGNLISSQEIDRDSDMYEYVIKCRERKSGASS